MAALRNEYKNGARQGGWRVVLQSLPLQIGAQTAAEHSSPVGLSSRELGWSRRCTGQDKGGSICKNLGPRGNGLGCSFSVTDAGMVQEQASHSTGKLVRTQYSGWIPSGQGDEGHHGGNLQGLGGSL